jgi:hypothetical protein
MYCGGLPQKTAPEELIQASSQLLGTTDAVQFVWQSMFACTSQEALQLVWHCAVQSAVGGTAAH